MAAGYAITIELNVETYAALEARARQLGKTVEAVAAECVQGEKLTLEQAVVKRERFLAALADLNDLASRQPPMTAEEFQEFLEECRQERDERPYGARD